MHTTSDCLESGYVCQTPLKENNFLGNIQACRFLENAICSALKPPLGGQQWLYFKNNLTFYEI